MTDEKSYDTAAEKKRQRQGSGIQARSQSFRSACQTDHPHPQATAGVAIGAGAARYEIVKLMASRASHGGPNGTRFTPQNEMGSPDLVQQILPVLL